MDEELLSEDDLRYFRALVKRNLLAQGFDWEESKRNKQQNGWLSWLGLAPKENEVLARNLSAIIDFDPSKIGTHHTKAQNSNENHEDNIRLFVRFSMKMLSLDLFSTQHEVGTPVQPTPLNSTELSEREIPNLRLSNSTMGSNFSSFTKASGPTFDSHLGQITSTTTTMMVPIRRTYSFSAEPPLTRFQISNIVVRLKMFQKGLSLHVAVQDLVGIDNFSRDSLYSEILYVKRDSISKAPSPQRQNQKSENLKQPQAHQPIVNLSKLEELTTQIEPNDNNSKVKLTESSASVMSELEKANELENSSLFKSQDQTIIDPLSQAQSNLIQQQSMQEPYLQMESEEERPKTENSETSKSKDSEIPKQSPLLFFHFKIHPPNQPDTDVLINAVIQPLVFVFPMPLVNRLAKFVSVERSQIKPEPVHVKATSPPFPTFTVSIPHSHKQETKKGKKKKNSLKV